MSNDVRDESGPLRHFRIGRRAMLQTLATGVGVAAFAPAATAAHVHHAAAAAAQPTETAPAARLFLDDHAFDTLSMLAEQIVPGSRSAGVAEVLDRLLSVESLDTQRRFMQALGDFERQAREAHGRPWKALTAGQADALLTRISALQDGDAARGPFDNIKWAVSETYYSTEAGMKELGWNGNIAFTPPAVCG